MLVSFHAGAEVRRLEQWWSQAVDIDFRFLDVADVAEDLERAGFSVEARLERASYAGEVDTRRRYLPGRRRN